MKQYLVSIIGIIIGIPLLIFTQWFFYNLLQMFFGTVGIYLFITGNIIATILVIIGVKDLGTLEQITDDESQVKGNT